MTTIKKTAVKVGDVRFARVHGMLARVTVLTIEDSGSCTVRNEDNGGKTAYVKSVRDLRETNGNRTA